MRLPRNVMAPQSFLFAFTSPPPCFPFVYLLLVLGFIALIGLKSQVKRAAREMAQKAYKERLKQIEMSEFDGELYDSYAKSVRSQVKSLRVILDSLQVMTHVVMSNV